MSSPLPDIRPKDGHAACACWFRTGGSDVSHVTAPRSIVSVVVGLFEHAFLVIVGFVLMVLGLGRGVTMIMLPAGIGIGRLGCGMFVSGFLVHLDQP